MKYLILLAFLAAVALSLSLNHQLRHPKALVSLGSPFPLAGGVGRLTLVKDASALDAEHLSIDNFIRANVPEVDGLKLVSYRQQVVAGTNYFYTYANLDEPTSSPIEINVWSKPWNNGFLKLTKPDGTVIIDGGQA